MLSSWAMDITTVMGSALASLSMVVVLPLVVTGSDPTVVVVVVVVVSEPVLPHADATNAMTDNATSHRYVLGADFLLIWSGLPMISGYATRKILTISRCNLSIANTFGGCAIALCGSYIDLACKRLAARSKCGAPDSATSLKNHVIGGEPSSALTKELPPVGVSWVTGGSGKNSRIGPE